MLNRTIAPKSKEIENINFVLPNTFKLNNNIPVYQYNLGSQEVLKIEFVFNAGTKFQSKSLVASTVKNLIKEGTSKHTSKQIADTIDFYGAFLETDLDNDRASVSLFTLSKHINNVLPILIDVILNAQFPQNEIDSYLKRQKQHFIVNKEKVSTLANQAYVKNIFKGNTYGKIASLSDYNNITRNDCINFYKKYYNIANAEIFIAGKSKISLQELLNQHIGNIPTNKTEKYFNFTKPTFTPTNEFILKEGAIQSAIRYGKPMFNITHKDFIPFQVLNTIFGGYFGSRLMSNIREDKGYTYGIGSEISSKQEMGNFIISTEVGSEVSNQTITEINKEITRMKNELVSTKELNVVKNYILGSLLQSSDGPFDMLELFKTIHYNNFNNNHYDLFINEVKNTSAKKIKDLANEHLTGFSIIIAGSVNFNL